MNLSAWATRMPARWLVPLMLLVFSLSALALRYNIQRAAIEKNVTAQEIQRLRERMNADQSHLDEIRGTDNPLLLRRIVTAMGLHDGITHAYLVGPDQRLVASLSRFEIGLTLDQALGSDSPALKAMAANGQSSSLLVVRAPDAPLLLARAPIQSGMTLLAQMDLSRPLALRAAATQAELAREGVFLLAAAAVLAALLHGFWFRRALQLVRALSQMGQGDLSARSGLSGNDELALIGAAADAMALRLQTSQSLLQRLTALVNRSPLVVLEWRNEDGWPVAFCSDSIKQWGYTPEEMIEGRLHYADLIHPEDLDKVNTEVAQFIAHGPDHYQQTYRIRHRDGRWIWVDDRTSLSRDGQGQVHSISGILLDITPQKLAEQAQIEQAAQLRMFFELPFLGMAISSPRDKRWLQVNDRLCDMLGYSRDELLRKTWAEMTPPGDLERNVALFDQLVAGQRDHYQMEKRFLRKDGAIVHTEIDVRAARSNSGTLTQLFATIQDVTQRKEVNAALRNSEQQLREAQRIGRMGSWERTADTHIGKWSEEMYRIFEVDPATFQPSFEALTSMVHEEDRAVLTETIPQALAQHGHYTLGLRIVLPDGRIKHLNVSGEIGHLEGQPDRMSGTVQDVSEQTLTRLALEESERLLAEAQRVAHMGHVSIDFRSGKIAWSDELYRLLGLDPAKDSASIETFLQIVHPDDRESVVATMSQARSQPAKGAFHIDHRIVVAGAERYLETRGQMLFDDEDLPLAMHGISLDITERKLAEMAKQDYQEMLEQAEELVKLGSWAFDARSGRLAISAQLFRNIGLEPSDRNPTDAEYLTRIHPEDRAMVAADMQGIRSNQVVRELLFRTDPAWGPMRWLRRTVRHVPAAAQERGPRHIGTLLDISEAVAAEGQLKHINEELEQRVVERTEQLSVANRELEAFSYTVSHDLKAPLRGIDGYSQLLQAEYGDRLDADGRLFVERIRQGVTHMSDLIADLLAYSRMERCEMTPTPIALRPLVDNIVASHIADIEKLQIQVTVGLDNVTLPLDREGISVVLRNLIGNALKFSRDNPTPRIDIGARREEGGRRILWVRDNGVGFDMAYHDRIFNIFQRLHRSEDFPGTGVGLALVAKAVQRMGGRVWAESSPGAGATFFLEFSE